jgi:sulfatase modifying factor 1
MSEQPCEFIRVESGALPSTSLIAVGSASEKKAASAIHPFLISRTEITLSKWLDIQEWAVQHGYDLHDAQGAATPGQPACKLNWFDAVKWCNARSEMEGLKPCYLVAVGDCVGQVYRKGQFEDVVEADNSELERLVDYDKEANGYKLPTEAEWEWAAIGGLKTKGYKFSGSDNLDDVGWYNGNIPADPKNAQWMWSTGLQKVSQKQPNELGLSDMSGNVSEWVEDLWDGQHRHLRGGSFRTDAEECEIISRSKADQTTRADSIGLRLVKVLECRNEPHSW